MWCFLFSFIFIAGPHISSNQAFFFFKKSNEDGRGCSNRTRWTFYELGFGIFYPCIPKWAQPTKALLSWHVIKHGRPGIAKNGRKSRKKILEFYRPFWLYRRKMTIQKCSVSFTFIVCTFNILIEMTANDVREFTFKYALSYFLLISCFNHRGKP